tara:strand:+ start:1354 stop:1596 length:243 start_codon:yes stop_codon:yes gene_type:complete
MSAALVHDLVKWLEGDEGPFYSWWEHGMLGHERGLYSDEHAEGFASCMRAIAEGEDEALELWDIQRPVAADLYVRLIVLT